MDNSCLSWVVPHVRRIEWLIEWLLIDWCYSSSKNVGGTEAEEKWTIIFPMRAFTQTIYMYWLSFKPFSSHPVNSLKMHRKFWRTSDSGFPIVWVGRRMLSDNTQHPLLQLWNIMENLGVSHSCVKVLYFGSEYL